ncbi:MAG: flagellar hook-basal body complex protein FliE [Rickettsiaceae bacterium H1]|nr:flagellar hook-basal body complex protein FliE [Rickettsiaceae bacterium H1]
MININNPISPVSSIINRNNLVDKEGSVAGAFESMISEIRKIDNKVQNLVMNKADLHELVTDISLIENNLKILVAIRDSLINAIQEITRMQV